MKKRYLLVLVSVAVLAGLVYYSDPPSMYRIIAGSDKSFLFYALLVSTAGALFRVMKWLVLLQGASFLDVAPVQFLGATISNFTPGKIGEPAKSVMLKSKTGTPVSRSLPSVMWERILDIAVLVLLSFLLVNTTGLYIYALGIFAVVVAAFLAVIYSRKFGSFVFGLLRRLPFMGRLSEQFVESFYKEKVPAGRILLSFFFTAAAWLADSAVFYLSFMALGIGLSPVFFAGLLAVSTIIGIASFLPGGLGSTDAVMILLLSASVATPAAAAGVFLARALTFWYSAFLGWLSLVHLGKSMDLKKVLE
ncbi:MAG: flippase-like domain-containing protein [Candidatus Aenigmarchaeota archaeon]|nr:flippase-like domain-containing protein [Candidatus Aenigmarchaeota archaeon]